MAYLIVEDFRGGVDRRRPIYASKPGTLWECENAHITMGGDIEKRKAFVDRGAFGSDTFGLFSQGDRLYTFGSVASVTVPSEVTYQRCQYVGGSMVEFIDADLFDGRIYLIARFGDGSVQHFYDGVLVADWNDGIVRAWMGSLSGMATTLAGLIGASANYSATAAGNVITITAAVDNVPFTVDTLAEDGGGTDDQTLVYATVTPAGVGQAQVGTLTLGGTFEQMDRFGARFSTGSPAVLEYFGNYAKPWGNAACVKTHKRKMYVGSGAVLFFSGVNDATAYNVDEDAGAGFEIVANHDGGSETVLSLEAYQGRVAPFSRRTIQLWTMQNDEDTNNFDQVLRNTGTRAARSTLEFGGNDVFYLADSGIRSIKARDASNNAFASGVGGAISKVVRQWMRSGASQDQIVAARAAVEPEEARFWMSIGERIFVYSWFPDENVAAWSWYTPGFVVDDFAVAGNTLYARADNTLYAYGGPSGEEYGSDYEVTVQLPFTTAQKDGTFKSISGMDMAADGAWQAWLKINPNNLTEPGVDMGAYDGVTFPQAGWPAVGHSTHVAPLLTHQGAGYACIAKIALYYQGAEQKS